MRCYREGNGDKISHIVATRARGTHIATEFQTTMRAAADNTQDGLVAAGLRLELAALLGRHDEECRVRESGAREALWVRV